MQGDPDTYRILGAAIAVHQELGPGFLEAVYQEALTIELGLRKVPATPQPELKISYKGTPLKTFYRADFVCFNSVVVELKAVDALTEKDVAQLLNCLKATGLRRGLLINFGARSLQHRRLVFGPKADEKSPESV
jgi:GxxExxY protein